MEIQEFRGETSDLEDIGERLLEEDCQRNSVEALKSFLLIHGTIEEVRPILEAKFSSSKKKHLLSMLKKILATLQEVIDTCCSMEVKVLC